MALAVLQECGRIFFDIVIPGLGFVTFRVVGKHQLSPAKGTLYNAVVKKKILESLGCLKGFNHICVQERKVQETTEK